MAVNPYYTLQHTLPWYTPFELEEEEIVLPDNLLTDAQLATDIEKHLPELWSLAGQYPVHLFEERVDPETGETVTQFPYEWSEDMQKVL